MRKSSEIFGARIKRLCSKVKFQLNEASWDLREFMSCTLATVFLLPDRLNAWQHVFTPTRSIATDQIALCVSRSASMCHHFLRVRSQMLEEVVC
jgi:hypothetical protein